MRFGSKTFLTNSSREAPEFIFAPKAKTGGATLDLRPGFSLAPLIPELKIGYHVCGDVKTWRFLNLEMLSCGRTTLEWKKKPSFLTDSFWKPASEE